MTALILGIVAIVCTCIGFIPAVGVLGFVGFVLGIVAWVMGKRAYVADPSDSKANTGRILGMISVIVALVVIILFIVFVAGCVGMAACVGASMIN